MKTAQLGATLLCMLLTAAAVLMPVPAQAQSGNGLEVVATLGSPMPIGITLSSDGRMFASFPRWTDKGAYTLAELVNGQPVPYPNADINKLNMADPKHSFVSVQGLLVDAKDRLWFLDTGSVNFSPVYYGGPKLVGIDLHTNQIIKMIYLGQPAIFPTSYINDLRIDLRRGTEGMAYITDSSDNGPNGIVVVDLASGTAWRRLNDHPSTKYDLATAMTLNLAGEPDQPHRLRMPGQQPMLVTTGSDSIAISPDGSRLYYASLVNRELYSVSVDALSDPSLRDDQVAATVKDEGAKGVSDGMETDNQGRIYTTNFEQHSIMRGTPGGAFTTLVSDPRMVWPDTLFITNDDYLYIMTDQLNREPRFHYGADLRTPPYYLLRMKIDAGPVRLGGQ